MAGGMFEKKGSGDQAKRAGHFNPKPRYINRARRCLDFSNEGNILLNTLVRQPPFPHEESVVKDRIIVSLQTKLRRQAVFSQQVMPKFLFKHPGISGRAMKRCNNMGP
jgi:hypothetical protein